MTPHPAPPKPPRLDRWPPAVRSAEVLRGTAVRCGPGLRLVSWPETPAVRASAIAAELSGRIGVQLTAAWIWGAARDPGARLEFSVPRGLPLPGTASSGVVLHEYRISEHETVRVGGFLVTSPVRTIYDLLRAPRFEAAERLACRVMLAYLVAGRSGFLDALPQRKRPFHDRVLRRLEKL